MKKFYSFLMVALLGVLSLSAQDKTITFTIDFDDPNAVTVTKDYSQTVPITAGVNTFTVPLQTSFDIRINSGYAFESIVNKAGTAQSFYYGSWYLSLWDDSNDGEAFVVKTINLDASRTASFSLTVDNAQMVSASFSGTSERLALQDGTHEYKFNPEVENYLYLSSAGSRKLYRVTLGGVEIPIDYSVAVPLTPGCEVTVEANYPDIPVTITIEYDEAATPNLVNNASINYSSVSGFNGKTLTAQAGDYIDLYVDTQKYKVDEMFINDEPYTPQYFYGSISFTVAGDTKVSIKAHPYGDITTYVTVDYPENITFYAGYQNPGNIVTLNPGRNEVKVSENTPVLSWTPNNGCEIVSVTTGTGEEITSTSVTATEGLELNIVTKKIVLDKSYVFWVDNTAAAQYYFRVNNSRREEFPIVDGYNIIDFTDSFNPYQISWAGAPVSYLYVNDEPLSPMYEGGSYWELTAQDGDVVKAFLSSSPTKCNVTFTVEGDGDATLTHDIIKTLAGWREGFSCFTGTRVAIAPAEDVIEAQCTVNGTLVNPTEASVFEFTVDNPATEVALVLKTPDGISDIELDDNAPKAIYNLQGIKVSGDRNNLPAGFYIIDGKKVYVK